MNIEKGSIAYKAGIRQGDKLLKVNGHFIASLPLEKVAYIINEAELPRRLTFQGAISMVVDETQVAREGHPGG